MNSNATAINNNTDSEKINAWEIEYPIFHHDNILEDAEEVEDLTKSPVWTPSYKHHSQLIMVTSSTSSTKKNNSTDNKSTRQKRKKNNAMTHDKDDFLNYKELDRDCSHDSDCDSLDAVDSDDDVSKKQQHDKSTKRIKKLQRRHETLQEDYSKLQDACTQKDIQLEIMERRNNHLQNQIMQLQIQLVDANRTINTVVAESNTRKSKLHALRNTSLSACSISNLLN